MIQSMQTLINRLSRGALVILTGPVYEVKKYRDTTQSTSWNNRNSKDKTSK